MGSVFKMPVQSWGGSCLGWWGWGGEGFLPTTALRGFQLLHPSEVWKTVFDTVLGSQRSVQRFEDKA